ncbi:hypothetical protein D3C86_2093330 [compost metagenome]
MHIKQEAHGVVVGYGDLCGSVLLCTLKVCSDGLEYANFLEDSVECGKACDGVFYTIAFNQSVLQVEHKYDGVI